MNQNIEMTLSAYLRKSTEQESSRSVPLVSLKADSSELRFRLVDIFSDRRSRWSDWLSEGEINTRDKAHLDREIQDCLKDLRE